MVLLAKYNLNPTNKSPFYKEPEVDRILPRKKYFILDTADSKSRRHSKLSYKLLQDASKSIGLDPAHYIGKRILRLNYLLDDSTRSNRIIEARVLFSNTNLVGACLSLDGDIVQELLRSITVLNSNLKISSIRNLIMI